MKVKTLHFQTIMIWAAGLIFLSACAAPAASNTMGQADELATVTFAEVEVGLGSPTPVHVIMDVNFPNACSQISDVTQSMIQDGENTRILIEVRLADMGGVCTDFPQSFRLQLPINASGLPKGLYSVEVNGVDAGSFEFKN